MIRWAVGALLKSKLLLLLLLLRRLLANPRRSVVQVHLMECFVRAQWR